MKKKTEHIRDGWNDHPPPPPPQKEKILLFLQLCHEPHDRKTDRLLILYRL